ncbi:MAG: hypothetical protein DI528_12515 [Shinella sp.]|nr:MAG: hypothetical protein DI528_12515 [Shinella sp.]
MPMVSRFFAVRTVCFAFSACKCVTRLILASPFFQFLSDGPASPLFCLDRILKSHIMAFDAE